MRSAFVVLLVTFFCLASALAQELLKNPGFEAGPAEGAPEGWKQYGGGVPESQLMVSPEGHAGARAVRLIDTGPNERDGRWSIGVQQSVPITGGKLYRASVWAKCLARNHEEAMNLQLSFQPSGRAFVARLTPPIGGDWQQFSVLARRRTATPASPSTSTPCTSGPANSSWMRRR